MFINESIYIFKPKDFVPRNRIFIGNNVIVEHYLHRPSNVEMAVKLIRTNLHDQKEFEKVLSKIKEEIHTCKRIPDSPYIVKLYGFCVYGDYFIICMEYMDLSVRELYKRYHRIEGYFPEFLLGIIGVSILRALIDLKTKHIMHRDIKPQNILINRKGEVKLCDFGVSRILQDSLATTITGTIPYWPPERFELDEDLDKTQKYDVRADIWSLGITLAEIAYGTLPFEVGREYNFALIQKSILNASEGITTKFNQYYDCDLQRWTKEFITNCLKPYEERPNYIKLCGTHFYKHYSNIVDSNTTRSNQFNPLVKVFLENEKVINIFQYMRAFFNLKVGF